MGDRANTVEFQAHFRKHASEAIEPWLEVVFWKLFSQPGRRNRITQRVASHFKANGTSPKELLHACSRYVENPSRDNFESFRKLFGFKTPVIAVAATFPAFLEPDSFPMVDTRIAKWVGSCLSLHNAKDSTGPQLIRPPFLDSTRTVLTMDDFEFVESWIRWCKYTAQKLTKCTSFVWRARDVEMAVFTAWGGRKDPHPKFHLNPLQNLYFS